MGAFLIELAIVVAGGGAALLLFWPRLANSIRWRATVTPLASIIGSGFLILGPILVNAFGHLAVLAMIGLCVAGYGFGAAIRFNIAQLASSPSDGHWTVQTERVASWVLAFAYVVSVAYYLNLLGAFGARLFDQPSEQLPQIITTLVYAVILYAGLSKGFAMLEWMERLSVSIKLAIIASLIAGLAVYTGIHWEAALLTAEADLKAIDLSSLPLMFGLIVTIQGFETSRYLDSEYSAAERQSSMRLAQVISTIIYVAYIALLSLGFSSTSFVANETAIIDLMIGVSAILGPLLIIAALSAQFSAAVADTQGSGGLVHELTKGKINAAGGYVGLTLVGVVLTWAADVFLIISYASRAFALYYAIQAVLAFVRARALGQHEGQPQIVRMALFASLAALGMACTLLATPFEGG